MGMHGVRKVGYWQGDLPESMESIVSVMGKVEKELLVLPQSLIGG